MTTSRSLSTSQSASNSDLLANLTVSELQVADGTERKSTIYLKIAIDDKEILTKLKQATTESSLVSFHPSSQMFLSLLRPSRMPGVHAHTLREIETPVADILKRVHEEQIIDITNESGGFLASVKISFSITKYPDVMKTIIERADQVDKQGKMAATLTGRIAGASDVVTKVSDGAQNLGQVIGPLGDALQSITSIMDKVADAHPLLKLSWTLLSSAYKAIQDQVKQDQSLCGLVENLKEMVALANECPNLKKIEGTIDVIKEIGSVTVDISCFVDRYARMSFTGRFVRPDGKMQQQIDGYTANCVKLQKMFKTRLSIETNQTASEIKRSLTVHYTAEEREKVLRWILSSSTVPQTNYNAASMRQLKDTTNWFVQGSQFKKWKETPSSFLWLVGKAGSGKTILSSSVITTLQVEGSPCAFFFFDSRDDQKQLQSFDSLVYSITYQICAALEALPESITKAYSSSGSGTTPPSLISLEKILVDAIQLLPLVFVVIDALDECKEIQATYSWLRNLMPNTSTSLRVLVTSRDVPSVSDYITRIPHETVRIDQYTANDIRSFITEQMLEPDLSVWSDEIKKTVEETLCEGADGMFRWAALQIEALKLCASSEDVLEQLKKLPDTLEQTYDQLIERIPERHRAGVITILSWLAVAKQDLFLEQLCEIAAFVPNSPDGILEFHLDKKWTTRAVEKFCASFLYINEAPLGHTDKDFVFLPSATTSRIVKLAHFSVKEYLTSSSRHISTTSDFHRTISESCVNYLTRFDGPNLVTPETIRNFPLAGYAACCWPQHLKEIDPGQTLQRAMCEVFQRDAVFLSWIRLYNEDNKYDTQNLTLELAEIGSPLYYSSLLGVTSVARALVTTRSDNISDVGGKYGTPLQAASYSGSFEVVKLLVEKGADVNAQAGEYNTALQAASYSGSMEIARLLLKNGADVNIQGGMFETALHAASIFGHVEIARLLLENGADVNFMGYMYGTALQEAATRGKLEVVKLLLEKDADVNIPGTGDGTAFHAASLSGHFDIVDLFLARGVDINLLGGNFGTALQAASNAAKLETVRFLLDKGADLNIQGGMYGTALQAASRSGDLDTVKLLLAKGADPNIQGGKYWTPLQAAVPSTSSEIVKLLLENGADANIQGGHYDTALHGAALYRNLDMVKLLLGNGADVDILGETYGTALSVASSSGNFEIVRLLLEKGANVNLEGGQYGTAIQAASYAGEINIVELLLKSRADVNIQGGEYGTGLHAASYRGNFDIVTLFLENGANANLQCGEYDSALQAASRSGYLEIVKLLVEKGADINLQGGEQGTALQAAVCSKNVDVVKFLLEKGADVNLQGGQYGTALQAASCLGDVEVVKLLLEKGVDVNIEGGWYGSALQAASDSGNLEIKKMLEDAGAHLANQPDESLQAEDNAFSNSIVAQE